MMGLFSKNRGKQKRYDPEQREPVLRRSICTGETTAGFRDRKDGRFHEVMVIRSERDLQAFMEQYGVEEIPKTIY